MQKGQFFIISAAIIVSALFLITEYILSYGKVELMQLEELNQLNYIQPIKDSLKNTVKASLQNSPDCARLEADLQEAESFLKKELIKRALVLDIRHSTACPKVNFEFNLTSQNFFSSTKFEYP